MGRLAANLLTHKGVKLGKQIGIQGTRPVAWAGKKVARGAWSAYRNRSRNSIRPTKTETKLLTYEP
jgi:type IV secretion system protein VirB6